MNQILTIFKKDARHLWPEILASVVLTVALVLIYPNTWLPQQYPGVLLSQIATALVVLVPVGWCVLITRLIQSESLVGDRQFWITRPYEWKKLLAAKALFLLVFLSIPTFTAHAVLLREAGFHPLSYLPGLLYNLLLLTGVLVLPLIALATITSTFVRMTLTLLGVIIGIAAMAALAATFSMQGANTPGDDDHWSFILFVSIFLTVILLQYATRRLWLSRTILAAVALFGVLMAFVPLDGYFVPLAYPQPASGAAPVQLSYPSTSPLGITTDLNYGKEKEVSIGIPIGVSGIAAGQAVSPDNVLVSIDAPNGLHWTSRWQPVYNDRLLPTTPFTRINVQIDHAFFNQVQSMPLSVHLTFALSQLQSGPTTQLPVGERDFTLPGIGICWLTQNEYVFGNDGINCRSAVRQPSLSYVTAYWSKERCSDSTPQPSAFPDTFGITWVGSLDRDPAELSLAPHLGSKYLLGRSVRSSRPRYARSFPQALHLPRHPHNHHPLSPGWPLPIPTHHPRPPSPIPSKARHRSKFFWSGV